MQCKLIDNVCFLPQGELFTAVHHQLHMQGNYRRDWTITSCNPHKEMRALQDLKIYLRYSCNECDFKRIVQYAFVKWATDIYLSIAQMHCISYLAIRMHQVKGNMSEKESSFQKPGVCMLEITNSATSNFNHLLYETKLDPNVLELACEWENCSAVDRF